jgi:hypothetical protein
MPDTRIDDPDREDDPNKSITNRLQSSLNVIEAGHKRLEAINAAGSTPPDDSKPVLESIKNEAAAIQALADEMLRSVGGDG